MAKLKNISFVMPVLNEEKYLETAVTSVFEQKTPGKKELVIALGPSTDKTNSIAATLAERYDSVVLVDNPSGQTAAGLNLAIEVSEYEVVIRVDAHSELSENYAATAVDTLNQTGAANVGGMMVAKGLTDFQKAVAFGYNSRFGLGGGSFHVGGSAGPADTVYLGCFRKSVIQELGLYSPKWVRGQDWELNLRIRQAGHSVWFNPDLKVGYYPRRSISALAKQFFQTGVWRGGLTRKNPMESSFRYYTPASGDCKLVRGPILDLLGRDHDRKLCNQPPRDQVKTLAAGSPTDHASLLGRRLLVRVGPRPQQGSVIDFARDQTKDCCVLLLHARHLLRQSRPRTKSPTGRAWPRA